MSDAYKTLIQQKLDSFRDWNLDVPIGTSWVALLDLSDSVITAIYSAYGDYINSMPHLSRVSADTLDTAFFKSIANNKPLILASGVSIDGQESLTMAPGGNNTTDTGPFMPYYGISNRAPFTGKNVSLNFTETNNSFVDLCAVPWLISSSVLGLVNKYRITGNITVVMLTRPKISYTNKGLGGTGIAPLWDGMTYNGYLNSTVGQPGPQVRKVYSFYNVIPTSIDNQQNIQYGDATIDTRRVTFNYDTHIITSELTGAQGDVVIGDLIQA